MTRTILLGFVSAVLSAQFVAPPPSRIQLNQVQPPAVDGPRLLMALPVPLPNGGTVTLWAQVAIGAGLVLDTTAKIPTLSASTIVVGGFRAPVVLSRNTDGTFASPDASCAIGLLFRNGVLQHEPGDYTVVNGAAKFADEIIAGERISATCR